MRTTLLYDGSFDGLLTAVFDVYARKLDDVNLQLEADYRAVMFERIMKVVTDNTRATRVLTGLKQKLSSMGIQRLYAAHLAGMENEHNSLLGFIRYAFDANQNIEEDYGNRHVVRVSQMVRMVRREKHRMEAFVRFQKLKDEIYYATVEPDFNVLPLLIRHFKSRYADQKWLIYDLKRKYGIYYDLHDTQFITLDFAETPRQSDLREAFNPDEIIYQHLWKNYFSSVNIASRKNTKLHVRHIPKRYWKHLTEKI